MFDDDDFGLGVLLPWQLVLLILICVIGYAIWYSQLPDEKKSQMCTDRAAKYQFESRYDNEHDCLVKIDATHWQKIEKFEKSGIIEFHDGTKQ